MVNNIYLAGYCHVVDVFLVCYYSCLISHYCITDIRATLSRLRKSLRNKTLAFKTIKDIHCHTVVMCGKHGEHPSCSIDDNTIRRIILCLLDEIRAFFEQSSFMKVNKNVLASSLRLMLDKYPNVKVSSHRSLVNHLIEMHSLKHCSIHFTNEEVELLWKD